MIRQFVSILFLLLGFTFCKSTQSGQTTDKPMTDLEQFWKELDQYQNKGLWQSALDKVNEVFPEIVKSGKNDQIAEAVFRGVGYHRYLEQKGSAEFINWMLAKLKDLDGNAKALSFSLLAEQMESYFQNNSWRLRDRSHDPNFRPQDIELWSAQHLLEYIDTLYQKSIVVVDQTERLTEYPKMIIWDKDAKDYNPSVYYLLMDRYLQFQSKDHQINFARLQPYVTQVQALGDEDQFTNWNIEGTGKYYQALKYYQSLLDYSSKNENDLLFVKTNLNRLEYAWSKSSNPDRKELFENSIEKLLSEYSGNAVYPEVAFYAANYYMSFENEEDEEIKKEYLSKARNLCAEVINSDLYKDQENCQIILDRINQADHQLSVEEVIIPGQPFLVSLSHKNISDVDMTLYVFTSSDWDQWASLENKERPGWLKNKRSYKNWKQEVTDEKDYLRHQVEIKIEALPVGIYLLASEAQGVSQFVIFHVSNLAWLNRQNQNVSQVYVVDLMSGLPLSDVKLEFYIQDYNSRSRKRRWIKVKEGLTDLSGKYDIDGNENRSYRLKLIYGQDSLFLNQGVYQRYGNRKFRPQSFTHLFTDRSIYRPGQIIHFKGIGMQNDQDRIPSYVVNHSVTVELLDVNQETVHKLELRTNQYGSFYGQFAIPQGLLKGYYSLRSSLGNSIHGIQVEEYKRPKFEVVFDPVVEPFVLDEEVVLPALANSLVNIPLDQVSYKYTITQLPVYLPYYGFFSRFYQQTPILIQQGTGTTDETGKFLVRFTPKSKPGTKPKDFNRYNVLVEVTDKNGETRSAEQTYMFNKVGKSIQVNGSSVYNERGPVVFNIEYRTTNGTALSGPLSWSLEQLSVPQKALRNRLWAAPDQWLITESEFKLTFPYDPYREENLIDNYAVKTVLNTSTYNYTEQSEFTIPDTLMPGAYKFRVSDGEASHDFYFTIVGVEDLDTRYGTHILAKSKTEPNDNFEYLLKGYGNTSNLLVDISSRTRSEVEWSEEGVQSIKFREAERGGAVLKIYQIVHNRYYSSTHRIDIPWTNKKLDVQLVTFRSLLEPGQEESWKIKVTNYQGQAVKGMVASTMYDAALDFFAPHHWRSDWYPHFSGGAFIRGLGFAAQRSSIFGQYDRGQNPELRGWFWLKSNAGYGFRGPAPTMRNRKLEEVSVMADNMEAPRTAEAPAMDERKQELAEGQHEMAKPIPQIRKNLNETVFFQPEVMLNEDGEAHFDFTMNEALTSWKWKLFIHDENLATGYHEEEVITRKEIMVFPNFPRVVREGDQVELPVKITNAGDQTQAVVATITYFDPLTGEELDLSWLDVQSKQLTLDPKTSDNVMWDLRIPDNYVSPIGYRTIASSESHSDGEEGVIPVLTNKLFLTETMPLTVKPDAIRNFDFKAYRDKADEQSVDPHKLTFEITENPIWLVVKSLPVLLRDQHPNAISSVNRVFANSIVKSIYESHPSIAMIIKQWANEGSLESPLHQDQELKNILIQETPWVTDANEETAQMRLLAGLSNPNVLNNALQSGIKELASYQNPDGGFSWCTGGYSNLNTTLYVLDQFRKLKQKNVVHPQTQDALGSIEEQAVPFIDQELLRIYKRTSDQKKQTSVSPMILRYLLVRKYLQSEHEYGTDLFKAVAYYTDIAYKHWVKHELGSQVNIGYLAHMNAETDIVGAINKSLIERSRNDEIMGTYWPAQVGYSWNSRPIELQSSIIELFTLTNQNKDLILACKTWLLRNKQTQYWRASTAISSAVYALLETSSQLIPVSQRVTVVIGGEDITPQQVDEAGTGYWKRSFEPSTSASQSQIEIRNPNKHTVWGAAYFQYFQEADQVKGFSETSLKASKNILFTKADGQVINLDQHQLKIGDRVRVVLSVESDRTYEFVHLRDLRGAGLEPLLSTSEYKYQSGLGYYRSPSDIGMDFYFDYLPKGKYIFEYDAYVAQAGDYSMGLAKIQCLYAPEYASHTEGSRLKVVSGLEQ